MCAFNVLGPLAYNPARDNVGTIVAVSAITIPVSFVVIWYFWEGRNWARWLALLMSVLSIVSLTTLSSSTLIERILVIVEAGFGVWLLYWLNTMPVRAFFRATPTRSTIEKVAAASASATATILVMVLIAGLTLQLFTPTSRPVYDAQISRDHHEALSGLHPPGERIIGLYSTATFSVREGGCLFTNERVLVYNNGIVGQQAAFAEIKDLRLLRERSYVKSSELTIVRSDDSQFYCELPSAATYPNDPSDFVDRLRRAWKEAADSRTPIVERSPRQDMLRVRTVSG
jgi:hypothetical protein